mmetsp:Transcript_116299/g.181714  ORF Transcript_116299/g.181714 Transcript_116299/m.181714 type:complete len:137 (-) Transcript_116299:1231-1641(-)
MMVLVRQKTATTTLENEALPGLVLDNAPASAVGSVSLGGGGALRRGLAKGAKAAVVLRASPDPDPEAVGTAEQSLRLTAVKAERAAKVAVEAERAARVRIKVAWQRAVPRSGRKLGRRAKEKRLCLRPKPMKRMPS